MGIITLTDRISVSVRAKNETESNSQKRATGRNIANALTSGGNANISDALADQLGNTSKPTIADEQGREWVAMSDIIAAGKKMQQEGAFDEKPEYDEASANGISLIYRVGSFRGKRAVNYNYRDTNYSWYTITGDCAIWATSSTPPSPKSSYPVSPSDIAASTNMYDYTLGIAVLGLSGTITIVEDEYRNGEFNKRYMPREDSGIAQGYIDWDPSFTFYGSQPYTVTENSVKEINDIFDGKNPNYSITHHGGGGSLIDWTKPDDEIEEDIRNLHETWDVSEHAGSTTANGTYVLAGPIEFNPGD